MNKVILCGRLTRDPEVRYSQNSQQAMAVARFTLAVDRKFKRDGDQQTADFISCIAFGKTAEFAEKYCRQGTKLIVEGRWQTGSYTNKDGNKVYTNDCLVESMEFAESKSSAQNNNNGNSRPQPSQADTPNMGNDGFMNIPDNVEDAGLPFN